MLDDFGARAKAKSDISGERICAALPDEKAFSGLRFNVEDQTFEFYAPAKMRDDPR